MQIPQYVVQGGIETKNIKYPYPRTDLTVRVSENLHDLMREIAYDMHMSLQDIGALAILQYCDPSGCQPDWQALPAEVR